MEITDYSDIFYTAVLWKKGTCPDVKVLDILVSKFSAC